MILAFTLIVGTSDSRRRHGRLLHLLDTPAAHQRVRDVDP
jgi:hypothetical protein